MDVVLVVAAIALTAALSVGCYYLRCITLDGAVASFAVGSIVAVFGSLNAFVLLTIFTMAGFAATFYGIRQKMAEGLQEGKSGERNWKNVLGVGLPPCIIVLAHYFLNFDPELFYVMFIATLAVAGADTIASEIGVRDKRTYLITTMKPCETGMNGGVSRLGTAVSTATAFVIAVLGWLIMDGCLDAMLLVPFVAGVFGNTLDSVFGVVLEDAGYISKYTNNASTALIGALFGGAIWVAVSRSSIIHIAPRVLRNYFKGQLLRISKR